MSRIVLVLCLSSLLFPSVASAAEPSFSRTEDVIYRRKFGTTLTFDVFTPTQQNGAAIVFAVSGGWYSAREMINVGFYSEYLNRGYTVFAVVHGSQPKFTIPEVLDDMHRALRFIRHNADKYHIDPDRIGICGASAGGHLSLMQGTAGTQGDPNAKDPIDRQSSRVQAVACFFPPTDFLNYGKPGEDAIGRGILVEYHAPFDFHDYDSKTKSFVAITDEKRIIELGKTISPINHVTKDDAPTLIIHGDADKLVPYQQAQIIVDKLKEVGVPAELINKPGQAHGWAQIEKDLIPMADWFDKYLARK